MNGMFGMELAPGEIPFDTAMSVLAIFNVACMACMSTKLT